jgi:hypothetical protein
MTPDEAALKIFQAYHYDECGRDVSPDTVGLSLVAEMATMLLEAEWVGTDNLDEPCCAYCFASSNLFDSPKKAPEAHSEFCEWLVLMKKIGLR